MATGKREINKSQVIRDYKKENPKAAPKAIAEAMQARGIGVSPGFVSSVLHTAKKKKKRGPRRATADAAPATAASEREILAMLKKAKKWVDEMGGLKQARAALNALAQVMD